MRLVLVCPVIVCLAGFSGLTACTQFPELDGTIASTDVNAPPPELVPLAPLLAQADQGAATGSDAQTQLSPRLAALRARAARLRGPVIPAAARARMLRGVR